MKHQFQSSPNPEIAGLIAILIKENNIFENELRSTHRDPFCCPVSVHLLDGSKSFQSFSKNISPVGIALISEENVFEDTAAQLAIYRVSNNDRSEVVAKCRWCKPFGTLFWISGWQFIRLHR